MSIRYRPYILLSFLVFACSLTGRSQQFNFTKYSVENGLPQSQVFALLQDARGYIWMGTRGGGLARFNGINFKTFTTRNGLPSNAVLSLVENDKKNLLIGTEEGLCEYDGLRFSNILLPLSSQPRVTTLYKDNKSRIWIGTNAGVFMLENGKISPLSFPSPYPHPWVNCIFQDSKGSFWVGTTKGIVFFNEKNDFRWYTKKDGLEDHYINAIVEDQKGNLWIGTYEKGFCIYDGKSFRRTGNSGLLEDKVIFSIMRDSKNDIWIATQKSGVFRWSSADSSFTSLDENDGLASNNTRTIIEDAWGNYWIGTSGGGVSKYSGQKFKYYNKENQLPENYIKSVFVDSKNRAWIGVKQKGVCVLDSNGITHFSDANGFRDVKVKAISEGKDGTIWLGTEEQGVFYYDSVDFRRVASLSDKLVQDMKRDANGVVWVATLGKGLAKISPDSAVGSTFKVKMYTAKDGLPREWITCLHVDQQNRLWFGTDNSGIGYIDENEKIIMINTSHGLGSNSVRAMAEDPYGNLWVGVSDDGISVVPLYEPKRKIRLIPANDSLGSSNIYYLFFDKKGTLYTGTHQGIFALKTDRNGQILEVNPLSRIDRRLGIETTHLSVSEDKNGNLLFGTQAGLVVYNPGFVFRNNVAPVLSFTSIILGTEPLQSTPYDSLLGPWYTLLKPLILNSDENRLGFEFTGINQTNPEHVLYSFRLLGSDTSWSIPGELNNITFSNLAPGQYTFEVRAGNEDGVWTAQPLGLKFVILPPFWQTWWFRLVFIAGIILLFIGILRLRIAQVRKKSERQKKDLELQKNLLELEQKALRLQMNPHFIFHALNSIQDLISSKDEATARFYLAKFSKLMRNILQNSMNSQVSLQEEIKTLEDYLSLGKFFADDSFDYKLTVEENCDPLETMIPPMLLQPFVENSIIHGFKHLDRKGHLDIHFNLVKRNGDSILECRITDNGIGREKATEMNMQRDQHHKSTALIVTQERLDILNADPEFRSLEISDLTDTEGKASGTRVILRVKQK